MTAPFIVLAYEIGFNHEQAVHCALAKVLSSDAMYCYNLSSMLPLAFQVVKYFPEVFEVGFVSDWLSIENGTVFKKSHLSIHKLMHDPIDGARIALESLFENNRL